MGPKWTKVYADDFFKRITEFDYYVTKHEKDPETNVAYELRLVDRISDVELGLVLYRPAKAYFIDEEVYNDLIEKRKAKP